MAFSELFSLRRGEEHRAHLKKRGGDKLKLSKKQLAIAALVIGSFLVVNIGLALYFMSAQVDISGGVVATVGSIAVYQSDGETPLVSHDFPLFMGGYPYSWTVEFFINNTGDVPVYVYWNMSTSSIDWTWNGQEYIHNEEAILKYKFEIAQAWSGPTTTDYWEVDTEAVYLLVDEGVMLRMKLMYSGSPNTSETFTLTESFYAYDS